MAVKKKYTLTGKRFYFQPQLLEGLDSTFIHAYSAVVSLRASQEGRREARKHCTNPEANRPAESGT
jgi:hypothetical protein